MTEERSLICITCPMGCQLAVSFDPETGHVLHIEGNECSRGQAYVEKELTNPTRMVTTTVRVNDGNWPQVPVHTAEAIPKRAIFSLLQELRELEVTAPLDCGQVILADGAGTGVDVLISRDLPAKDIIELDQDD